MWCSMDETPTVVARVPWQGRLSYLFSDGRILPVVRGGADDEPPDDLDDDSDDGDDESDDEGSDKEPVRDKGRRDLSKENARRRRLLRESRAETATLRAELDALKGKDKPDIERLTSDLEKAQTRAEQAEAHHATGDLQMNLVFGYLAGDGDPKKIQKAVKLMMADRDQFESDGDGGWEGVEEALDSFFEEFPEFKSVARKPKDDEGDDDEEETPPKPTNTGKRPSGKPMNGRATNKSGHDLASLARRFPALNR